MKFFILPLKYHFIKTIKFKISSNISAEVVLTFSKVMLSPKSHWRKSSGFSSFMFQEITGVDICAYF